MSTDDSDPPVPKTLIFDLMGTCLDWHNSVIPVLQRALAEAASRNKLPAPRFEDASRLALDWRQGFFDDIHARFTAGEPAEDIDETHRRVLRRILAEARWQILKGFPAQTEDDCVRAWHKQHAWPDVVPALPRLRRFFDVCVLANGSTRLQIDIVKSSGLTFDALFSSELLGLTKPDPAIYHKALSLLRRRPQECVMVAAHAYDLRAAKEMGMRTVYIQRWTEDGNEDLNAVRAEVDFFIDGRKATANAGGLLKLAELPRAAWEL